MSSLFLIVGLIVCLFCGWLEAKVYLQQPQALQTAFASDKIERKTLFLTADEIHQIEEQARVKMDSTIVSYYIARGPNGIDGIAFFDRRIVRSMPVTYMTVISAKGTVERVDILSFEEPDEYLPPARWLALYKNHELDNDLAIGHAIPHIAGASLTSQAMNDGVRLMLAVFNVGVKQTL